MTNSILEEKRRLESLARKEKEEFLEQNPDTPIMVTYKIDELPEKGVNMAAIQPKNSKLRQILIQKGHLYLNFVYDYHDDDDEK